MPATETLPKDSPAPGYGARVLTVEPRGVERVPDSERHGGALSQFTLWLGSNLTIADFALGFLPVSLGLPWGWSVGAIVLGNFLGALAVAACSPMGAVYGMPQLIIGRVTFGRLGSRLPAAFNYLSTLGWLTVNTVLGAFGMEVLLPGMPFWLAVLVMVLVQGLLAVYGHNLIHTFERVMAVALGITFLVVTVIALSHGGRLGAYHQTSIGSWATFAVVVAAALSYVGSWAPYASDYSRYLPATTRPGAIAGWTFLGSFLASAWVEVVGAMVAVLAVSGSDPIARLHQAAGGFGAVAVVAIILGGIAANALNGYSNALAAGALGLRLPRWSLAVAAGALCLMASLAGSGRFEQNYEQFLLMLGYWIMPWLGVLVVDYYLVSRRDRGGGISLEAVVARARAWSWSGLAAFALGVLVSVPFMNGPYFEGPAAHALAGVDVSFYVGFAVAAATFWGLRAGGAGRLPAATPSP